MTSDDDLCVIRPAADDLDGAISYWIRATLDVPIHGADEPYCWGLWVSQSKESFERYAKTFDGDQSGDGSFGWCPVPMKYYRRSDGSWPSLERDVEWFGGNERPKIVLRPSDDQLAIDQRDGISWDKAIEIARITMHG